MSDEKARKAVRDATLALLDRLEAAAAKQAWAFGACPHINMQTTMTRETTFDFCDDCGATRETFVASPLLKEGEQLCMRAADFRRVGRPQ